MTDPVASEVTQQIETPPPATGGGDPSPAADPGSNASDWALSLDGDVRTALAPKNYKSANDLAKSYLDLEGKIGQKGLSLPGEAATDEDWQTWEGWNQLGRPDDAAEYTFVMPEGQEVNDSDTVFQNSMRPLFHKAGLNQRQVAILNEGWNSMNGDNQAPQAAETKGKHDAGVAELKTEWGGNFESNVELANHAIRNLGGDQLAKELKEVKLDNHPAMAKAFQKIGAVMVGDGTLDIGAVSSFSGTPAQADAEVKKLKADKSFQKVFLDKRHPEHKAAVQRLQRLNAQAKAG